MGFGTRVSRHFFSRSERVKAVDIHPTEPLMLSALYDGHLKVFNYSSLQLFAEIDVSPLPLRAAVFVASRDIIVCAGDDCSIRCFALHTQEKLHEVLNAHKDFIRHLAIHPTKGLVLSSSDDMTIKLWDMDQGWIRLCSFEGHSHYVMQTAWNPRDPTLFASCSLDRSIKVWGLGHAISGSKATSSSDAVISMPHFTLLGHERGVNAIAYSNSGERPYLVSGADDSTVRVWDYQTKQCIQVLRGHSKNVCSVLCGGGDPHALPVLFSAGEDGKLCMWHALTYKEEASLDLGLDRVWSLALRLPGSSGEGGVGGPTGLIVAVGSDAGTLVLKMGKDGPVVSAHGGKAVMSRGFDLVQLNLKMLTEEFAEGEKIQCPAKELGHSDIFPQVISHHPNGRFLAVVGDGEYVIYTTLILRNKAFGTCEDFCWSLENHYAVLEKGNRVKIYSNFEEAFNFTPPFVVEELFGGYLLGLRSDESISFYDWNSYRLIRRIEVSPTAVFWSPNGMLVAIATRDNLTSTSSSQAAGVDRLYILRHDKFAVMAANTAQALEEEGGIPIAFDLIHQAEESVSSGIWLSECFVYITRNCRMRYFCGGRTQTLRTLEVKELSILSVVPEQNRIYLVGPNHAVYVFSLSQAAIQYQVAVAHGDLEEANAIFPQLPLEAQDDAARALQAHGYFSEALAVAKDEQLRFELALAIGNLPLCAELIRSSSSSPSVQRQRWAAVGDAALQKGSFTLAAAAFWECRDYASLLLLYSSSGDVENLRQLGAAAAAAQQQQIAFVCYLLSHRLEDCVELLLAGDKLPEAALFARTYCPSAIDKTVKAWRGARVAVAAAAAGGKRARSHAYKAKEHEVQLPAYPSERPEAFARLDAAKEAETMLSEFYSRQVPAASYQKVKDLLEADVLQTIEEGGPDALRTMLLGDDISFASTEPPHQHSPQANGETASVISSQGTPITAAAGGPSPMSTAAPAASLSPDGWQQQPPAQQPQQQPLQQLQQEPKQQQQQQQYSGVFSPQRGLEQFSSPKVQQQGVASPFSFMQQQQQQQQQQAVQEEQVLQQQKELLLQQQLQQGQQQQQQQQQPPHVSNPFAAASNPFSHAGLVKDGFSFGVGGGLATPQQQQQQQELQQFEQQLQQQLLLKEHPELLLAQRLQQQEELLEDDARRLSEEAWGDPLEASSGDGDEGLHFRDVE